MYSTATMITLAAQKRGEDNLSNIRNEDRIPAVYYGMGHDAVSISVPMKDFLKVWKEAGETTTVVLDFGNEKVTTLIHDMQHHPITSVPTHVDFLIIDMKKEIEVKVPLEFTGLAEAEKGNIGNLVKVMHEVEVRALPNDLPHTLKIDVTNLAEVDSQIHVKDIALPKGVQMVTDADEVVALIAAFKEEVEETTPVDLSAIEVEKKGKKDEDGEGSAETK